MLAVTLVATGCRTAREPYPNPTGLPPTPGLPETTIRQTRQSPSLPGETITAPGKTIRLEWDYPEEELPGITFEVCELNTMKPIATVTGSTSIRIPAEKAYQLFTVCASNPSGRVLATRDLVLNGGFEAGPDRWTLTGNVNTFTAASANYYRPASGARGLTFNQSQKPCNGIASQVVPTIPGRVYTLTFDAGIAAPSPTIKHPQSMVVAMLGATTGVTRTVFLKAPPGAEALYERQAISHRADSRTMTISFRDTSTETDSVDLLLDNVQIE
jgi:hypothetical protein